MNKDQILASYDELLEALDHERKHEEEYFRSLTLSKTFKERIEAGILWYPISIERTHYTIAEKVEIEMIPAKPSAAGDRNAFREGASAIFFINTEERIEVRGTISFASRKKVRIILNDDYTVKSLVHNPSNCGVELIYDDRPYRVMRQTIEEVKEAKEGSIQVLRDGIAMGALEQDKVKWPNAITKSDILNSSQQEAIEGCIEAQYLGIIHGPPGTGKTTTLVNLIQLLATKEKKILVTAPSNNAVDLLARQLSHAGLAVLRVGNVTRIGDNIAHLCLDEKVRMHKDWQHIKQVKIEAEAAKSEAKKYKRKFGPQQKRDRIAFQREARELRKWAKELEQRLVDQILHDSVVICTTLIGCAHPSISEWRYDTVVIDEGSQALEAESWTAMLKGRRTIIAGDHMQLPPTVKSKEAADRGLSSTVLDKMTGRINASFLLDTQYRMHADILSFSNEHFYGGKLQTPDFVSQRCLIGDDEVITFIDTSGCGFEEERSRHHRSLANEGEYHILREHMLSIPHLLTPDVSIGIISPYARQVTKIREEKSKDAVLRHLDITVNSIDGFQGQEKDVIYISLVRSNDDGEIGFLKDHRRLNVALTRARYKLVVIGDMATLGSDPMYMKLAEHFEKNGVYKSAWEYMA